MLKSIVLGAALALVSVLPAWACDTVQSKVVPISMCVDAAMWTPQAATKPQEFLYFDTEQTVGFTLITELGKTTDADYRAAIIKNASAAGTPAVLAERTEVIGGQKWNVIEYSTESSGSKLVFQNFYIVNPGVGAIQMAFWSGDTDVTKAAVRAGMVLGSVKFTD